MSLIGRSKFLNVWLLASLWGLLSAPFSQNLFASGIFGQDSQDSHGTLRLGIMSYTLSDGAKQYAGSGSVLNYEYSRYARFNQALIFGFRQATDSVSQKDAYHAAYGGYRIFPMGVGFPLLVSTNNSLISYDAKYKPYAEGSLGLGRALLETDGSGGAEYGSDTLSIGIGGGVLMHFFKRWAVDVHILYEIVQGRGGTENSIAASGNNFYFLIGNGLLF